MTRATGASLWLHPMCEIANSATERFELPH